MAKECDEVFDFWTEPIDFGDSEPDSKRVYCVDIAQLKWDQGRFRWPWIESDNGSVDCSRAEGMEWSRKE
jgi:hypothetical protein